MSEMIFVSALVFVFSTYQLFQVLKMKEAPNGNKVTAWLLYGVMLVAVAAINVVFYS
ncbi:hypothetical protein ACDX78_05855 [Virgibacillus oceani]